MSDDKTFIKKKQNKLLSRAGLEGKTLGIRALLHR